MEVVVRKYGGSSLSTFNKVLAVAEFTAAAMRAGRSLVLVVSAQGDTTDNLLRAVDEVSGQVRSPTVAREIDQLLATGECASAALLALAIRRLGVPAMSLTGAQAGIRAEGNPGSGVISHVRAGRVRRLLAEGIIPVVTGFQGITTGSDVITLGRGGSDTTAVAMAAVLGARSCEIYTDVAGVFAADPRIVSEARRLVSVDLSTMAEMAFAGARVLHSRAVELAMIYGVEIQVRSSLTHGPGTLISLPPRADDPMLENDGAISAIVHDLDVARVLVHSRAARTDLAAEVLSALAGLSIPIDMVARSGPYEDEFRMGFTIGRADIDRLRLALAAITAGPTVSLRVDDELGKVSVVGIGLLSRPEYAARMITALSAEGITTSWISTSQLRASAIVARHRVIRAVEVLYREFAADLAAPPALSPVPATAQPN
ncbi:MAG TPA: aspartate kinase [Streptosporangiaceae bacterium]|jgi:aspartate kinase|nr:aspartate kinase [Streptosporangiaceae bacterium]